MAPPEPTKLQSSPAQQQQQQQQKQTGNASAKKKSNSNKKKRLAATSKPKAPNEDTNNETQTMKQNGEPRDGYESSNNDEQEEGEKPKQATEVNAQLTTNGHGNGTSTSSPLPSPSTRTTAAAKTSIAEGTPDSTDATARLEAMTQEREALRAEVEQLRKQLETIQETHNHETHNQETSKLRQDLEESELAKDNAEEQYQTLLGRVEKIKETLGSRLARDKEELEEAKEHIDQLEAQNDELLTSGDAYKAQVQGLTTELQDANRELASLRSRNNLSQQNSAREKDDLVRQINHLRSEAEAAKDAMADWEVLAMEERSIRESLTEKTAALEEQTTTLRESYEKAASERDAQAQAVDSLQRALQDLQDARKTELRDMVESYEEQLQALKRLVKEADARAGEAEGVRNSLQTELERTAPFEKEVKEKNLLIGKLRHEAIVLNDHLTKALRFLKKSKPEENIDRQIVTNHFLQFLNLDRSDPRKFQILQVIAGLLGWTDEQREQAGLARPGASANNSLRLPTSPFHRTPSTPSLNAEFFESTPTTSAHRESLADLWAGFLERSVEEAGPSRKGSVSSTATGATGMTGTGRSEGNKGGLGG